MDEPVVGIIGATGAVGRVVARQSRHLGRARVRLGGRDVSSLRRLAERVAGAVSTHHVDIHDAQSLAAFCQGCRIVINCAGPSLRLLDVVARCAFAAGADYVDPGGHVPVRESLAALDYAGAGRIALLTAGMMPGLSALLTRWLAAQDLDRAIRLTAYVGGRDRLTQGSAIDYVLNLSNAHGEARAEWRHGVKVVRALAPEENASIPFFPPVVTAYPYFSAEAEELARDLKLDGVRWYNVFEGGHMLRALGRLQGAALGKGDVDGAAADLVRSAELDLFGLRPYQLFVLRLEGEVDNRPVVRQVALRGSGAHDLTGGISVLAAASLLRGEIGPGLHDAGAIMRSDTVEHLRAMPCVEAFHVTSDDSGGWDEDGTL
jgi:hypothetical protein